MLNTAAKCHTHSLTHTQTFIPFNWSNFYFRMLISQFNLIQFYLFSEIGIENFPHCLFSSIVLRNYFSICEMNINFDLYNAQVVFVKSEWMHITQFINSHHTQLQWAHKKWRQQKKRRQNEAHTQYLVELLFHSSDRLGNVAMFQRSLW